MPDAPQPMTTVLRRRFLLQYLLPASLLVLASNCFAQDEEMLEWPGTLERSGHPIREVVFNVRDGADGPRFESMVYADEPFKISDQSMAEDSLYFRWTPGNKDAVCRLTMLGDDEGVDDFGGDYRGDCVIEGSGKKITLQISPPADYKIRSKGDKKKKEKQKEKDGIDQSESE